MKHSKKVILSLGSNLGNRRENLVAAIAALQNFCKVLARSKIYQTPPVGYENQRDFLNAALQVETDCEPFELLDLCKALEAKMGRVASFKNAPRPIDVDIIFFEDFTAQSEKLTIPHPRWHERDFVKTPLLDLLEKGAFSSPFFSDVLQTLQNTSRAFAPFSDF